MLSSTACNEQMQPSSDLDLQAEIDRINTQMQALFEQEKQTGLSRQMELMNLVCMKSS